MDSDHDELLKKFLFIEKCNELYLAPQEIRYRVPQGMDADELLSIIEGMRDKKAETVLGLANAEGQRYRYWETPTIKRILHEIDLKGYDTKWSQIQQQLFKELIVNAVIDEALYSSMIEGARTTRKKAEEMIRKGVSPRDRSEQMTLNNYRALQFIQKHLDQPASKELLNELHAILVENTLDSEDAAYAGDYRQDQRYVLHRNETVHVPPPPKQLNVLMESLYRWINFEAADFVYLHPVVKAAIIHFFFVYVHPYVDGNGRVARALMYYYLLKKGYGFFQFFSISKAISAKRSEYYAAIKNVEESRVDLTGFVLFSVHMVKEAIETVEMEWERSHLFTQIVEVRPDLNERQQRFLKTMLKGNGIPMTIRKYQKTFDVVYETARRDLMGLAEKDIVEISRKGRQQYFGLKKL